MACWIRRFNYVWNAEQPLTAIGFVNGLYDAPAQAVRPIEKLLPKRRPTRSKASPEIRDRDTVGARGSAVRFHVLPGSFHVGRVDNCFHQRHGK